MDATGNDMVPVREPNFNQERAAVARLSRDELEDRYHRLLDENVVLKKHACKQEDKIKKLATKLIRVLSDKKRLEMNVVGPSRRLPSDIKAEELVEDQQHKIQELERQVELLRDKLTVAKQQLIGAPTSKPKPQKSTRPQQMLSMGLMSPGSIAMGPGPPPGHLLSQQAQRLLEEARNENRMLEENIGTFKEQINLLDQEMEQLKEQHKIKAANAEEESQVLKAQI